MDWLAVELWFSPLMPEDELDVAGDRLSAVFDEFGAQGVEIKPRLRVIVGYLTADAAYEKRLRVLRERLEWMFEAKSLPTAQSLRVKRFTEAEWTASLYGSLKPRPLGRHLVVVPSWEEYLPDEGQVVITIERCQGFGTGDHPTTQLCLELVEAYVAPGMTVMDVGTGSGILAVAAAKLGAKRVYAGDYDPVSVEAAEGNVRANGVEAVVTVCVADGFDIPMDGGAALDLAVSNINTAIILRLIPRALEVVPKGAIWILSGITIDNWPEVDAALGAGGALVVERREKGKWVAAAARR
jgi:ribosomal protein L11 methyltransferase